MRPLPPEGVCLVQVPKRTTDCEAQAARWEDWLCMPVETATQFHMFKVK